MGIQDGMFFGFVPHRLDVPGSPKLSNFPYNIMFQSKSDYRYSAIYITHLDSYEERDGKQIMTYFNESDPNAKVILSYDPKESVWQGEKFYLDKSVGQTYGTKWNMFFIHLTILGCDENELTKAHGIITTHHMNNIDEYESVGAWKEAVEKDGYTAGTTVCRGLSKTMKDKNMSFPQAYKYLIQNKILTLFGKNYAIDVKIFNY